jgi:hypothetical protein
MPTDRGLKPLNTRRDARIRKLVASGIRPVDLAEAYDLTRARISQICYRDPSRLKKRDE